VEPELPELLEEPPELLELVPGMPLLPLEPLELPHSPPPPPSSQLGPPLEELVSPLEEPLELEEPLVVPLEEPLVVPLEEPLVVPLEDPELVEPPELVELVLPLEPPELVELVLPLEPPELVELVLPLELPPSGRPYVRMFVMPFEQKTFGCTQAATLSVRATYSLPVVRPRPVTTPMMSLFESRTAPPVSSDSPCGMSVMYAFGNERNESSFDATLSKRMPLP
jgi:hypothetical protein